jgi:hypothetical protein
LGSDTVELVTAEARRLALEIARCPLIAECLAHPLSGHPCDKVVGWQRRQLPHRYTADPWVGHLSVAPILFVSSNPSADDGVEPLAPGEIVWSSNDDLILQVSDRYFDEGQTPGVEGGIYQVDAEGRRAPNWIRYWAFARARAAELLGCAPRPGLDYALTEVVHCGSKGEHGVWEAVTVCAPRYLSRVLELSPATVVVCVGSVAKWVFEKQLGIGGDSALWGPDNVAGRERAVLRIPAPGARRVRRSLNAHLTTEQLDRLRALLV